jgi:peptide chain release factor 1
MPTIIEVRPGEGGDDAEHFAGQLITAIQNYLRRQGCTASTKTGASRTTEIMLGPGHLRLPPIAGTHRVQRIPDNDSSGRRHTSTVTVAVLQVDRDRPPAGLGRRELEVQTKRGTGPGGQHRNKTSSAVRVRHRPSGLVVELNRGRSQRQNLEQAKQELARRLGQAVARQATAERNAARTSQIATGERPAKTFTWNQQRAEMLDHTSGRRYPLGELLKGRLEMLS